MLAWSSFLVDLETIMKNATIAGLLVFCIIFLAAVLFSWEYALFLAFIMLLGVSLTNIVMKR